MLRRSRAEDARDLATLGPQVRYSRPRYFERPARSLHIATTAKRSWLRSHRAMRDLLHSRTRRRLAWGKVTCQQGLGDLSVSWPLGSPHTESIEATSSRSSIAASRACPFAYLKFAVSSYVRMWKAVTRRALRDFRSTVPVLVFLRGCACARQGAGFRLGFHNMTPGRSWLMGMRRQPCRPLHCQAATACRIVAAITRVHTVPRRDARRAQTGSRRMRGSSSNINAFHSTFGNLHRASPKTGARCATIAIARRGVRKPGIGWEQARSEQGPHQGLLQAATSRTCNSQVAGAAAVIVTTVQTNIARARVYCIYGSGGVVAAPGQACGHTLAHTPQHRHLFAS
ncbi:hypothetical protein C8Q73DRAFT_87859 [Cubamyces lactineus]|nr:hypothetical protein C8Q73DRAFT_87859 [Cubamyces lactineus]